MDDNISEATERAADEPQDAAADSPQVDAAPSETEPTADDTSPGDRKLSDEAARHRVAARAAETRLAIAEARITDMQKDEVTRILEKRFVSADDAWLLPEVNVEAMLDENGKVDQQLVHEVADAICEARPHWRIRPQPVGAPPSAVTGSGRPPGEGMPAKPGWSELLRGKSAG